MPQKRWKRWRQLCKSVHGLNVSVWVFGGFTKNNISHQMLILRHLLATSIHAYPSGSENPGWYPLLRKSIWHVPSASVACCIRSFWDASLASQKLFLCQLKTKVFKEPFLITLHCTIQCPHFNLIQLRQITVQHYLLISDCIYQISSSLLSNAKGDRAYAFSPPFPSEVYHS